MTHYPFNWPPSYSWHVPGGVIRNSVDFWWSNTLVTCNYFGLTDQLILLILNFHSLLWSIKKVGDNLQSKCGVRFICQQKSNICSFQQTNLWQSLTSKLIWAAICNIRAENFNFTLEEKYLSTKYLAKLKRCLESFKKSQHHDISTV